MNNLSPLIPVGLGLLVLGWVIFRSVVRRGMRAKQASPERQVAEAKAEFDRLESRGSRALRDAPPEVLRWQAEIFELTREVHGQLDTKIALLAATVRLADQRLAELKQLVATVEQQLEPKLPVNPNQRSDETDPINPTQKGSEHF
jgi:hypothetical protein